MKILLNTDSVQTYPNGERLRDSNTTKWKLASQIILCHLVNSFGEEGTQNKDSGNNNHSPFE